MACSASTSRATATPPEPARRSGCAQRAEAAGILEVRDLYPMHGDFNDDLRRLGAAWLAGHVAVQLDPADVRWLRADASGETARAA